VPEEVLESQERQPPAAAQPPPNRTEAGAPHVSEHGCVGTPVTSEKHCRNCAVALTEGNAFCANCGQKVIVDRLSVRESLLDFWFTMVRPVFVLVRALLVRPGYVARDYVEGKRKRFLGPYAFLFLIVGLASAAYVLSGLKVVHGKGIVLGTASPNPETLNALAVAAAGNFFQRHVNIVILLDTPLLAVYSRLLFRKCGMSFAEHLVLASYTSGMRSLFTTIVVIPGSLVILRLGGTDPIYFKAAASLLWFAYFMFAMVQFSRDHRMLSGLKGVLAAVLAWVTSQIVLSAITMGFVLSHG
jgi:predicted nucleic acid-binding Zn ribbon protein